MVSLVVYVWTEVIISCFQAAVVGFLYRLSTVEVETRDEEGNYGKAHAIDSY